MTRFSVRSYQLLGKKFQPELGVFAKLRVLWAIHRFLAQDLGALTRAICEKCPLFARCVRSKTTGRTLSTSFFENYLQDARQRQQTDEFTELYRLRPRIEGKQAELVSHGLRKTRYLGISKRRLQRLWLATAVNLQRMFKLAENRGSYLTTFLTPVCEANSTAMMA